MTALGFTVSPTLLPSAFYRQCPSYKIPPIHCAMVHTMLLYVVHAKLLSISTWKKAAALIAGVTQCYKAIKSEKNLNRRLTEYKRLWHRWIFVPLRALFYSGDLCSPHVLIPAQLLFCTLPLPFSPTHVLVKLIMIRTLGSMLYNPCKLLTSGTFNYFHIQWL